MTPVITEVGGKLVPDGNDVIGVTTGNLARNFLGAEFQRVGPGGGQ